MIEKRRSRVGAIGSLWSAVVLAVVLAMTVGATAHAATGDLLRTFNAANPEGCGTNVGVAFDGHSLLVSCVDDFGTGHTNIDYISPADGSLDHSLQVNGHNGLAAISYDATRNQIWACDAPSGNNPASGTQVYLVNPADGSSVSKFAVAAGDGCWDGLAFDAADDSIYTSADQSPNVFHYTSSGTLIHEYTGVDALLGGRGDSGIAVGGSQLFLATPQTDASNPQPSIYTVPKDFSTSTKLADENLHLEGMACDPVTFAPKAAVWVISAFSRELDAYEIPAGSCGVGGRGVQNTTSVSTSLSGGGHSGASITVAQGTGVSDQGTLSGGTANAGGTMSYAVYSDAACSHSVASAGTAPVTNGSAGASNAAALPAGTYYWQARYSGDSNNLPSSSACGSEVLKVTAPAATPTPTPTPPKPKAPLPAGGPSAAQLALTCSGQKLSLTDVLLSRGRVQLSGVAVASLIGKSVAIVFDGGKTVARAIVGRDGVFRTSAPLPPRRQRGNARYQAKAGALRSLNLKLTRRLILNPPTSSGGNVTLVGQVLPPLAKPVVAITVEQQVSCGKTVVVDKVKPSRSGRFHIVVKAPAGQHAAIYRLVTRVRKTSRNPKSFPTASLPEPVALA